MPCKLVISPTAEPQLTKNYVSTSYDRGNYWELDTTIQMDVFCQNSTAPTDQLEYATTLYMDADVQFNANVTYHVTLGFELYKLDLKYTGYDKERSVISVQSNFVINQELNIGIGVLEGVIETIFD